MARTVGDVALLMSDAAGPRPLGPSTVPEPGSVIEPAEVNELATSIVAVLQGESGTVESLLARTADATSYLASKDEIYARLVMEYQRHAIEKLRRIDPKLDVIQRLRAIIAVTWEQNMAAEEYQRLVQYCSRDDFRASLSDDTRARLQKQDDEYFALIAEVLEEGVRRSLMPVPIQEEWKC